MTPTGPTPPFDAETYWREHCHDCAHPNHPLRRCSEIVGGTFEPDYCPCSAEMPAMEQRIEQAEADLATALALLRLLDNAYGPFKGFRHRIAGLLARHPQEAPDDR